MELLTPGTGLIIWQTIIFGLLVLILSRVAWRPIIDSLKIREENIQDSLDAAENAKKEMRELQAENEVLLAEARAERDKMMKDAQKVANSIRDEAKEEAVKTSSRMIEDARSQINAEKQAALAEVKNQVAELSLSIAEKILRNNLADDKRQQQLLKDLMKEYKLN
jgi:F-type H+-transporting ATPase subunit b